MSACAFSPPAVAAHAANRICRRRAEPAYAKAWARRTVVRAAERQRSNASPPRWTGCPTGRLRGPKDAASVVRGLAQRGVAAALSLLLVVAPAAPAPAAEAVHIPASSDPGVLAVQRDLLETWAIAREAFYDADLNGLGREGWDRLVAKALMGAYLSSDGDAAALQIPNMLEQLGDPYTRWQPPREYETFRVGTDGELQGGVGMMIALDPESRRLVVLGAIEGSPADHAGIMEGDVIESINGLSTRGWSMERTAKFLRGKAGTTVNVKLTRVSNQIPGVPGRPEPAVFPRSAAEPPTVEVKRVALTRGRVDISPIVSTLIADHGHTFGYIRLATFSSNAPREMAKAISSMEGAGVEGYVLDLRGNPGGVVDAGVDIAGMWLDGPQTVMNIDGRDRRQVVKLQPHEALSDKPLVLLVNQGSASASEILAGALRDNHRASLIGSTTFGKGRIQSVFELADGSAFLLTVAQYTTPRGTAIDQVGITPDAMCLSDDEVPDIQDTLLSGEPVDRAPAAMREAVKMRRRQVILQGDPCVVSGMRALRGETLPGTLTAQELDIQRPSSVQIIEVPQDDRA